VADDDNNVDAQDLGGADSGSEDLGGGSDLSVEDMELDASAVDMSGDDLMTSDMPDAAPDDMSPDLDVAPMITACRLQAQSPAMATVGQPSPVLCAVVYASGVTDRAGQGSGIVGELGYAESGAAGDVTSYTYTPMTYNVDKDGLSSGDLADDEYGASFNINMAGDYRYVARFRLSSAPGEWLYCDLKGTDAQRPFDVQQAGALRVAPPSGGAVGFCQTETASASVAAGEATGGIVGRAFVPGVTDGVGQGAGVQAELVWGPRGDAPATWTNRATAAYKEDATGLNPNATTNDRYEVSLTPAMEGDLGFAYRFSVDGGATWSLCDTDGSDGTAAGFEPAKVGQLTVSPPTARVSYCITETPTASAAAGQRSGGINGVVYVAGATGGAGQGPGVLSRILWGPASGSPATWTSVTPATYANDADGLGAGDRANDRYTAQLVPGAAGQFGYVYQFSVDSGATWSSCDTDGSDGTAAGFEAAKRGQLTATASSGPDECRMQFPINKDVAVGAQVPLYGRVRKAGVTDVGDNNPQVRAEAWIGGISADLSNPNQWTKLTAQFNPSSAGQAEDEYVVVWTASQSANYMKIYYRVSMDAGATWTFCDIDGSSGAADFNPDGFAAVEPWLIGVPDYPNYCHNFTGNLTKSLSSPSTPSVTMEVYEPGVTEGNGGANSGQLFVDVGYGPVGSNPIKQGAFTWRSLGYARVDPGAPNNYQYEGAVMGPMDAPAAGTYNVVVRTRKAGEALRFAYCDGLQSSADFLISAAPKLTVTP
jgi:hypothetical protein